MNKTENQKKQIAAESVKIRKSREKLKKWLEQCERQITPQALEKKTIEIHQRIARHAHHRTVLTQKAIHLFDENQNSAALSARVANLATILTLKT